MQNMQHMQHMHKTTQHNKTLIARIAVVGTFSRDSCEDAFTNCHQTRRLAWRNRTSRGSGTRRLTARATPSGGGAGIPDWDRHSYVREWLQRDRVQAATQEVQTMHVAACGSPGTPVGQANGAVRSMTAAPVTANHVIRAETDMASATVLSVLASTPGPRGSRKPGAALACKLCVLHRSHAADRAPPPPIHSLQHVSAECG